MPKKNENQVQCRVSVASDAATVYKFLNTKAGRAAFWAQDAPEINGVIHFSFSNSMHHKGRILQRVQGQLFSVEYFGGSTATFTLDREKNGGTVVTLTETSIPKEWLADHKAGWVTVLLMLKAAVDHGIDLRNLYPERSWEHGFVDV